MPRTIRFHLDEHRDPAIAQGLRRHGIDATTTPEAGLIGRTDKESVAYALSLGRVIFTQDRDYLRLHVGGDPHAGIAYHHQQTRSIGAVIDALSSSGKFTSPKGWRAGLNISKRLSGNAPVFASSH